MKSKTLQKSVISVVLILGLLATTAIITGCKDKTETNITETVKSCSPGCTMPCCADTAKTIEKAACDTVKTCTPGCTKPCCTAKETIEKAEETVKEAVDDAVKACPAGCTCAKCEAAKLVK